MLSPEPEIREAKTGGSPLLAVASIPKRENPIHHPETEGEQRRNDVRFNESSSASSAFPKAFQMCEL